MSNDIDALRSHLFDALAGLKNDTMAIEKAKAISDMAQTIINTAKVEVDYAKVTGQKSSTFLGNTFVEKKPDTPELPKGITGVTQHRIK